MPQMNPMNWNMLFMLFSLTLIMTMPFMFFMFMPQKLKNKNFLNKFYSKFTKW